MSLPKYSYPVYTLTVPSTGKQLKYRPFLVKDEKNLLLSQQSEETLTMFDTLKSVIESCILDKTNIENLAIFDIEYIFTQLRTKSIGEQVTLIFTCKNQECKKKEEYSFLINPEIEKHPEHTNKIELFDKVGVVMKYPGVQQLNIMKTMDFTNANDVIQLIVSCIDYVYDEDQVYYAKDQTETELTNFVEELPRSSSEKLRNFFNTLPKLKQTVDYTCKHCNAINQYTIEGIENFF